MEGRFRTDLALEQRELSPGGGHELEGVEAVEETKGGFRVTTIDILDERGSLLLCKPIGAMSPSSWIPCCAGGSAALPRRRSCSPASCARCCHPPARGSHWWPGWATPP